MKKNYPNMLARMKQVPLSLWKQYMKHVNTLGCAVYLPKEAAE